MDNYLAELTAAQLRMTLGRWERALAWCIHNRPEKAYTIRSLSKAVIAAQRLKENQR